MILQFPTDQFEKILKENLGQDNQSEIAIITSAFDKRKKMFEAVLSKCNDKSTLFELTNSNNLQMESEALLFKRKKLSVDNDNKTPKNIKFLAL